MKRAVLLLMLFLVVAFCLATGARPSSAFICGVAAGELAAAAVRHAVQSAASVRGVPTGQERRSGENPSVCVG